MYLNNAYNIPIRIVFGLDYPVMPPSIYVIPAEGMILNVGNNVTSEGEVHFDYLLTWNTQKSSIGEALTAMG